MCCSTNNNNILLFSLFLSLLKFKKGTIVIIILYSF